MPPLRDSIIVDRVAYTVRHYRRKPGGRWPLVKRYACTVGAIGHTTPGGQFEITHKTLTPDWKIPASVSAEREGEIVRFFLDDGVTPNPENPFEGGFLSIFDGVGLHGTKFDPQVGTRSSHGCIRMHTKDLVELYGRIEVGTPIYIA